MLTAFVMIHVEPSRIVEIAQAIANLPNVAEVYSVTGEFDLMAIVRLPEYDQLADIVPQDLAKIDGIRRTNTVLAFRRFSAEDLKAAWDIGLS